MNRFAQLVVGAVSLGMVGLAGAPAYSATVIDYNPVTAGAGNEPQDVLPAWSADASGYWSNNGSYLDQNVPAGASSSYTSPKVAGTMVKGVTDYTVEFRVRPVSDVGSTASTDWYARDLVIWTDDAYQYNVIIDKYSTGNSGTGELRYGSGSYSENLPTLVSGIDWSTPHTIAASYTGSTGKFNIFVDGVLKTTIADSALQGAAASWAPWQDAVTIGSPTTAGAVVHNEWYSIKVDNTALPVPEPTLMGLGGLGGLMMLRRRRSIGR